MIVAIITGVYVAGITIFVPVFGFNAVVEQSASNVYYQYVECVVPNSIWDTIFEFYYLLYTLLFILTALLLA